jgi:hypothetical protein
MLRNLALYYFFLGKSVNYDDPKILLLQVLLLVLWKKHFFLGANLWKALGPAPGPERPKQQPGRRHARPHVRQRR